MTLKVNHIVLHQLVKQDESTLQMILRDSLLTVSDATEQMMEELGRDKPGPKLSDEPQTKDKE